MIARLRAVSLRTRIAVLAAASVAIAVVIASAGAFVLTQRQLLNEVDDSLVTRAAFGWRPGPELGPPGGSDYVLQLISPEGGISSGDSALILPVSQSDLGVARGARTAYLRSVSVEGIHLRILTAPVRFGDGSIGPPTFSGPDTDEQPLGAVQIGRTLSEVDRALSRLGLLLFFVALGGVALAAGLGVLVARSALRPVGRLTRAAEEVAKTQDLHQAIDVDRTDELGRLAASFNAMLRAIDASREQQQRLITDASHELRTPLTSIRTNIDILVRQGEMDPHEREGLLADLRSELVELTNLVGELVELATEPGASDEPVEDVRVDDIAEQVAARAHRRTGRDIEVQTVPVVVRGRPTQLERAVTNLVDNACKWGPADRPVDLTVSADNGSVTVRVRDHGPGIGADDRPHVFDRFYRAPAARSMPGSGLGLSIVKQAVEAHGGRVWADDAPGGGASLGFELPGAERVDAEAPG